MTLICLAVVSLAGLEFSVGESLVGRFAQVTTCRSDIPQGPSVGLSDLMVSIR